MSSASSSCSSPAAATPPSAAPPSSAPAAGLATKPSPSFYKRQLPPTCIDYASKEGKQLFKLALNEGNMESYFPLASQFTTQSEPAYCGLGTLCMVLNALGVDPQRQWKGPWRWFDDSMLDCCRPLEEVKKAGITLSEFGCLAVCNGLTAQVNRADLVTKAHFLHDIQSTSTQEEKVLCVSYHRGTLGQTGSGHFSPIAGYCAERNMVLLMDVARFKYPPHWVSVDLLWSALLPHDSETGKPRGYVILHRRDLDLTTASAAMLATPLAKLALDASTTANLVRTLRALPHALASAPTPPTSVDRALQVVLGAIPHDLLRAVQQRTVADQSHVGPRACAKPKSEPEAYDETSAQTAAALDTFRDAYQRQLDLVLARVRDTHVFGHVASALAALAADTSSRDTLDAALVTLLLVSLPLDSITTPAAGLPEPVVREMHHLWALESVPLVVKHEVLGLRSQVDALVRTWCDACGMTREEGEREGKCTKKRAGSPSVEDNDQVKRGRTETDGVFAPLALEPREQSSVRGCKGSDGSSDACGCCRKANA